MTAVVECADVVIIENKPPIENAATATGIKSEAPSDITEKTVDANKDVNAVVAVKEQASDLISEDPNAWRPHVSLFST
ncbi:unnamed protein product [Strongylus vulgaris]|uniref:Uncharacterized protein n=1 Tax=Strongylus vulgaris TaxID=40348 RepID=A0A3P7LLA4_STRVU|nr:unnamed protein product [Strongylus vulgaris]